MKCLTASEAIKYYGEAKQAVKRIFLSSEHHT